MKSLPIIFWIHGLLFHFAVSSSSSSSSSSPSSSWKGAPWQSADNCQSTAAEQARYADLSPTIFSPTGRLHPVERTVEQVREAHPQSNVVVALRCRDGSVMLSTVPLSPYLNTTVTPLQNQTEQNNTISTRNNAFESSSSLFVIENEMPNDDNDDSNNILPIVELAPEALGATAGQAMESQVLRIRLQSLAHALVEDDLEDNIQSYPLSLSRLARELADQLQVPTQKTSRSSLPLLASATVVMGRDELWRIDPTGQFWNCHAAIIGRQSDRVEEALVTKLMERMKEKEDEGDTDEVDMTLYLQSISCDEALDMVCECLHSVFWPKPINLRGLPEGVKASIPSIPWVAVTLRNTQLQQLSGKTPFRRIQRGAFLPPILRDGEEDKDGTIKGDVGSQI